MDKQGPSQGYQCIVIQLSVLTKAPEYEWGKKESSVIRLTIIRMNLMLHAYSHSKVIGLVAEG